MPQMCASHAIQVGSLKAAFAFWQVQEKIRRTLHAVARRPASIEEANRRQNRWLAEQVRDPDLPANGGVVEEQPPMDPPLQESIHEQPHPLGDELYEQMSEDENMEGTKDMDIKSVGLILKELDRCQRELVEKCEREILVASIGSWRIPESIQT